MHSELSYNVNQVGFSFGKPGGRHRTYIIAGIERGGTSPTVMTTVRVSIAPGSRLTWRTRPSLTETDRLGRRAWRARRTRPRETYCGTISTRFSLVTKNRQLREIRIACSNHSRRSSHNLSVCVLESLCIATNG